MFPQKHILFVDDDDTNLEIGKRILKSSGYEITLAKNGLEAYELYTSQPEIFDLIITDFHMPKMNGRELSQKMDSVDADIPIILCTCRKDISEEDLKRWKIDALLTKPYRPDEIRSLVKSFERNRHCSSIISN